MKKISILLILFGSLYATRHVEVCDNPIDEVEKHSNYSCRVYCKKKGSNFYSFDAGTNNCQCCQHGIGLASSLLY